MRTFKNLITAKKRREVELKDRVMHLQREVNKLEEIICELEQRVT